MYIQNFLNKIADKDSTFFTGVPDSQLKPLCDYLMKTYGISDKHIIASNEGNCTALAAGYYLATGKVPVVYMQNSGIGNMANPSISLLNSEVYNIPCIFIIGWRGEPGIKDEPQHIYQGKVTLDLLKVLGIEYMVIDKETTEEDIEKRMKVLGPLIDKGKSIAFVIRKGSITYDEKVLYKNNNIMLREEVIRHIINKTEEDIIVSTTGKASRELFEIREQNGQSHKYDFLTVGSMGHSSSIALGISLQKPSSKIWCIDGDGAILMHMGAMALIGSNKPSNLIHIVINNNAHETVGGMPTVADKINLIQIAKGCGYPIAISVDNYLDLDKALDEANSSKTLMFIEVKVSLGSREDLGRPTITAIENKNNFMDYLKEKE